MKKLLLASLSVLLLAAGVHAQNVSDGAEPLTWLGLDLSALKFVKTDETVTDEELQDKYFAGWNDLILHEPKRYDLVKATGHDQVSYYTDAVTEVNKKASGAFITRDKKEYEHLDQAAIARMVKKYNLKGKTGLGLVFVMEGMDKGREEAAMWVTYINMATKEVLLTQRMYGKSGGFSFRNYWASPVFKVMKDMPSRRSQWKKSR